MVAVLVAMTLGTGMCAAAPIGSRRKTGEDYARAFTDEARGRSVTWNDRACTFTENAPNADRLGLATRVTVVPAALVTVVVQSRTAPAGTLDITFRCDPPFDKCIDHMLRYGSNISSGDRLTEYTMTVAGSIADRPRVIADLGQLRVACIAMSEDGGR